ncbi:hypothetical protein HRR99_09350 [Agrobacterium vaccinii]|uniref:hypothetical protein n=1 Tax=Agrobacterium vaccinii TaxID=2735528 RepID=UPI001E3F2027|nr:hypothetical protein [Agrobacterium vaccinii]UHS61705.1 hypothetical protein HRR99_09350 [Agrobacterium vaccinii]
MEKAERSIFIQIARTLDQGAYGVAGAGAAGAGVAGAGVDGAGVAGAGVAGAGVAGCVVVAGGGLAVVPVVLVV